VCAGIQPHDSAGWDDVFRNDTQTSQHCLSGDLCTCTVEEDSTSVLNER